MNLRTAAATVGVGLAGAVASTRALRVEELDPPLGREQATYRWRGFDVAYTEAGDPAAPDLALVHGVNAAGSSHEFRHVVDELAEDYHVLAPDLPGFGGSDRPPLRYSASLYESFVTDFLADCTDRATVVAGSLSGAYASVAAESADVEELVLVCPTADTMPWRRVWLRELLRSPVLGDLLFDAIVSKPSIRANLRDHGFADPANISEEWVEYDWQTAHLPGARYAPASFVAGFLDPDVDLAAVLGRLDADLTLVWGSEAETTPPEEGRALAEEVGATFVEMSGADLLPHAERPDEFLELF